MKLGKFPSVSDFVYYSTIWGVFSGALVLQVGSSLFLFDLLMVINLLLMWCFLTPPRIPRWWVGMMVFLLASGAIGVVRETDTIGLVMKQIVGIGVSALYFANFFQIPDVTVSRAFSTYARFAYWLTLAAFILWPVQIAISGGLTRLQGVASEPAAYCLLTLPAYYWYAHLWSTGRKHRKEVFAITIGLALSGSSLGYIGVAFGLVLLFGKGGIRVILVPLVAAALLVGIYFASADFRLRANDTALSLVKADVTGANVSTYALISNLIVTERVVAEHPVLGNGLGSHVMSNKAYIRDVPGEEVLESMGWEEGSNTQDAASLTLRSLSELGILGFLTILWFVIHFRVRGRSDSAAISNAILIAFFEKLLRGGGYANPEQFFFIVMYLLNYRNYHCQLSAAGRGLGRRMRWTRAPLLEQARAAGGVELA